ncbi:cation efflux family-domain-containing protein [Daedaleopsis nitida]|nr:cation efflux family-domain-containing protein [Daedaleopsis nitida]
MASLTARRPHSTQPTGKGKEPDRAQNVAPDSHDHDHDHGSHLHSHSHSHGFFGSLMHSHSHGEGGHEKDAEQIVQAFKGRGDRGSQITLVGLASNVVLTGAKGAAGWYMNSAALLADAGHCLGDLVGDLITLFSWRLSRKPPSERYPYGYGKFEVLGTTVVSLLLTGGALGIGFHSYSLLLETLAPMLASMGPGPAHDILARIVDFAQAVPQVAAEHAHIHAHSHSHGHGHGGALDPNAAWFAAVSVLAKEWLYRITKRVADEERSPVLLANAVHHRSDAYGSAVALFAILGNWWFPHLALDPIGGLLVSVLIFQQGWGLLMTALRQLTDAGVSQSTKAVLIDALQPLHEHSPSASLLAVTDVRAMRTGANMFVDLNAHVPAGLSVDDAVVLETEIREALVKARRDIKEVRVRFRPTKEGSEA